MRESTTVQAWLQEGREKGEARRREDLRKIAQNLLKAGSTLAQVAQVMEMRVAETEALLN